LADDFVKCKRHRARVKAVEFTFRFC